jgi:hypothetical protein
MIDKEILTDQLEILNGVYFKGINKLILMSIDKQQMSLNKEDLEKNLINMVNEVVLNKKDLHLVFDGARKKYTSNFNEKEKIEVLAKVILNQDDIDPIVAGMTVISSMQFIEDYKNSNKFEKIEGFKTKTGITLYCHKKTLEDLKLNDIKPTIGNLLIKEFVILSKD